MKKMTALLLSVLMLLGCMGAAGNGISAGAGAEAAAVGLPAEGDTVEGFTAKEIREFPLIGATQVLFEHNATGARLLYIANDDHNRVFHLAFATRAHDDKGLPHVFEHATLSGSDKYPSKTLFFNLSYQTYNTYMNANTHNFMTTYPVASLSEEQLLRLADFYTDSCLHPSVLKDESIYREEAWRYRMMSPEADLTVEGTVYSEMLGAAKKIAADEKVAGLLGQFGLTDAAAKIDEAYAQFEAASEEDQPVLTAAQYANDEGACVEIIMAKDEESISFVGARAGQVLTMDLSAMGMLEAGLKLDEAAKTLDLSAKFVSDGSVVDLTLAAAGGEQGGTATVAANVKSGETAVALKLNCKVTADAPVFEAADGLAVFDLDNATEESAAAFQQDLQVGLGTVMGVVMQKYPEIMQLMQSAPSESAPAEPESEVPAA